MNEPSGEARTAWEEHYAAKPRVWSGRVNPRLAEIGPQISGSRALELGCGEGADAIWLAEHGWTVLAVDISETALERAREAARARGVADRIEFRQLDLADGVPDGPFDLVTAQFLHSPVEIDRPPILRGAAGTLAPGGTLLIVDHAAAPPWASRLHHYDFPAAQAVVEGLDLDASEWERVRVERSERAARGPDGEEVTLVDNVIVLRRTGPVR